MNNPGNYIGVAVAALFGLLGVGLMAGMLFRWWKALYGEEVRASAKVVRRYDQTVETRHRMQRPRHRRRHTVVFAIGTEEKAFFVSEESYRACPIGRQGTLCYRGSRFLGFFEER